MTNETKRQLGLLVDQQLSLATSERDDLRYRLRVTEQRVEHLQGLQIELRAYVCPSCLGHGSIRVFYAQDDVKAETCTACNGTGLPKERT